MEYKFSGVYCIKNTVNGKVYIGSSRNMPYRKTNHFYLLNKNIHNNRHLQFAYNKYGRENFIFIVLENIVESRLLIREQHWMDKLKASDRNYGYNIRPRADSHAQSNETKKILSLIKIGKSNLPNGKHSEETKLKQSQSYDPTKHRSVIGKDNPFFGKHHTQETKKLINESRKDKKSILCFDKDWNFIKEYESISSASRDVDVDDICISRCISRPHRYKTAGGFKWKLK